MRNGCGKVIHIFFTTYWPFNFTASFSNFSFVIPLRMFSPAMCSCSCIFLCSDLVHSSVAWISRHLNCLTQFLDWFSVCLKDVFEPRTCPRFLLFSPWYGILRRNWERGGRKGHQQLIDALNYFLCWSKRHKKSLKKSVGLSSFICTRSAGS